MRAPSTLPVTGARRRMRSDHDGGPESPPNPLGSRHDGGPESPPNPPRSRTPPPPAVDEAGTAEPDPAPRSRAVPVHEASSIPVPAAQAERIEPAPLVTPAPSPPSVSYPTIDLESIPDSIIPPTLAPSKPLLASEALMEDLAPVEPARRDARTWCAAFGACLLLVGTLPLLQVLPGGLREALPWLVNGAIAIVASFTRVTYRQRAVAMVVLGFLSGLAAVRLADGLLLNAAGGAPWGLSRFLAAIGIPAALLFRARYRAYAGARVFLATALAMSVPFVAHTVLRLMHGGVSALVSVTSVAALLVIVASFTGFMGSETTGAGAYVGPGTILVIAAELAARGIARQGTGQAALIASFSGAFAFGVAACLAALGIFQILAWRFAADARRIDLHRKPSEPDRTPDVEPGSDWSTRE
jgi:hypothetical protein